MFICPIYLGMISRISQLICVSTTEVIQGRPWISRPKKEERCISLHPIGIKALRGTWENLNYDVCLCKKKPRSFYRGHIQNGLRPSLDELSFPVHRVGKKTATGGNLFLFVSFLLLTRMYRIFLKQLF